MALISSSLHQLKALLQLTKIYCEQYQVKLVGSKTKMLIFTNSNMDNQVNVELATNSISIDGEIITPSSQGTHVGVIRSVEGNIPNIVERLSSHRKAIFAVLHAGLARGHRANPAAALRVEKLYGSSVILSGMASLVLTIKEEKMLDQHYKVHIERLLRLHQSTPHPVVFLLAGCLPLVGQLHVRMF